MENAYLLLILLPPIVSFLVQFIFGRQMGDRVSASIAVFSVFIAFLCSGYLTILLLNTQENYIYYNLSDWINIGGVVAGFNFHFDRLSALFCLVITGIGLLIHVYSVGYMKNEQNTFRYFSYLSLFIFFMLVLVLGDNLVLLFIGWEGVGLCSYLLIGYYGDKKSANVASQKAFVVNRIGDYGLIMAMVMGYYLFSSFSFSEINSTAPQLLSEGSLDQSLLSVFLLLLFLACTGKSAQIPLYTWILDAMEAPTPVSALIHAATMVTSGLYLIARLHPVFSLSPDVLFIIAVTGAITALVAAFIACAQTNIKQILAFSTISQLGFMFLAMGVGAYEAGIFHMFTHAFFKALLFLSAGSVIYALHHEQDITKMDGLSNFMPHTSRCFAMGAYAISSLPLASGFFSKDEILWATFNSIHGSSILWGVALFTAALTSFYMYRVLFKVFHVSTGKVKACSESPPIMIIPLYIFGFVSIFAGLLSIPEYLNPFAGENLFHGFFHGFFPTLEVNDESKNRLFDYVLLISGTTMVLSGFFIARILYLGSHKGLFTNKSFLYTLAKNKLYLDNVYDVVANKSINWFGGVLFKNTFEHLIETFTEMIGGLIFAVSAKIRQLQNGQVSFYSMVILASLLFVFTLIF